MANVKPEKVVYGLRKVHYSVLDDSTPGAPVFSPPKPMPGAVNLGLSQTGEVMESYADNIVYFSTTINNGYEGTLELMSISDEFRREVLDERIGADGVLYESANAKPKHFAVLAEFDTDTVAKRILLYNCIANRPQVSGQTKTDKTEPQTATLDIKARPLEAGDDLLVKASTTASTNEAAYAAWFSKVTLPAENVPVAKV